MLWEIFSAKIPFDQRKPDEISMLVLGGSRPYIPVGLIPFAYLVERGWHADPEERPTARVMANTVEAFYRGALSTTLRSTALRLDMKPIREHYNRMRKFRYKQNTALPYRAMSKPSSTSILAISRDSEFTRHDEYLNTLLSMDLVNQFSLHQVNFIWNILL